MDNYQNAVVCDDTVFCSGIGYAGLITVQEDTLYISPLNAPPPYTNLVILLDANDRKAINHLLQIHEAPSTPSTPSTSDYAEALAHRLDALADQMRAETQGNVAAFGNIDNEARTMNTRLYALETRVEKHLARLMALDDFRAAQSNWNLRTNQLQNMVEADQRLHDEQSTATRRRLNEHAEFAGHLNQRIVSIEQTLRTLHDSTAAQIARLIARLEALEYHDQQEIADAAHYDANIAQWLNDQRAEDTGGA